MHDLSTIQAMNLEAVEHTAPVTPIKGDFVPEEPRIPSGFIPLTNPTGEDLLVRVSSITAILDKSSPGAYAEVHTFSGAYPVQESVEEIYRRMDMS